jgi:formylglycine-generating enzyme required for sulfatase activity
MNEDGPGCGTDAPLAVGSRDASVSGLFDLSGNVAEWTGDYYGETFEPCDPAPCENPTGPLDGAERVVRGGAFDDMFASAFRNAKRTKTPPETMSPAIGGRCVK